MGGLGKSVLAVGAGFIAAQASIAGVQAIMSKSIGAAMAYEAQMAEIRALTGATEKDTDLLTGAIFDMAKTMPKSPAELGSAAYFILSSGIEDAADAADVLKIAAKASTVGLGETERVADALTTVINAYGLEAGDAAEVTDVMMEAVKQGKAEASEFAGVLGRVVPLAAQMGISFEEVAANLATFTRLGVSADEAATGLRQVMASLLKPTEQQKEAMQELGFSADGLRQQIREKGLLATLGEMMEATGGNEAAIAKLFPNVRALTSVLGTAGVQMDSYREILDATNNATGNLDEGFSIVSDTAKFKMGVAMNELNLELMEMGSEVLPSLVTLVKDVTAVLRTLLNPVESLVVGFQTLTSEIEEGQSAVIAFGGRMRVTEDDLRRMAKVGKITAEEFVAMGRASGIADEHLQVLAAGTALYESVLKEMEIELYNADVGLSLLEVSELNAGIAATQAAQETGGYSATLGGLQSALDAASAAQERFLSTLSGITGQRTQETNAIDQQINALKQELNAAQQAEIGQQSYGGAVESATSAIDEQIKALENQAAALIPQAIEDEIIALEHEAAVLQLLAAEIEGQILAKQNYIDSTQDAADAVQAEIDAQEDLLKSLGSTLKGIDKQIAAEKKLAAARAGTLPHNIKLNKLELEKEKLLQKVGGETDNLTDADKARLEAIENAIEAEHRSIRIKELEAEATELQAEKSGDHLRALEAEREEVIRQMAAAEENIRVRQEYIDALHPPELLAEIEALKDQKAEIDRQIAATQNLKTQRELYIKTLVPPELQQEIEKLRDEKKALDDVKGAAGGAAGATRGLTGDLANQIAHLNLEREAIDLVTEGWKLQGEALLGLPTLPDILAQLEQFKNLLLIQLGQALVEAIKAFDWARVAEINKQIGAVAAMTFAQHGFHGTVTGPRGFFIEPGRTERVDITPGGGGGGATGRVVHVHLHVESLLPPNEVQLADAVQQLLPDIRRAVVV